MTGSHHMYAERAFDFGNGPEPYRNAGDGPYTHYIDNTASGATDSGNPFGTKAKPRMTFPSRLPAGSVVEIHGGPYSFRNLADKQAAFGLGTAERPVFVRGPSSGERPLMGRDLLVLGSYLVVENLGFSMTRISVRAYVPGDIHHVALRNLEMAGDGQQGRSNAAINIGQWGFTNASQISYVVVWNNHIHDYGNWQPTAENDECGVTVSGYDTRHVWIMDNRIYHMGGDSIRVGNNAGWTPPYTSDHAYIARNVMHHNGENAVDVKLMRDVVVSHNTMYGFAPSVSDPGAAVVVHYMPSNVWLVANEIYDAANGLSCSGAANLYVLGNVIRDTTTAIRFWGDGEMHIAGNTIARFADGIKCVGGNGRPHPIINNILAWRNDPEEGYHIDYNESTLANNSAMHNNLLYQPAGKIRIRWARAVYYTAEALLALEGKGRDCLISDPLFSDPAGCDFSLCNTAALRSPAIDKAATVPYEAMYEACFGQSIAFDRAGRKRPVDGDGNGSACTDIGAYEAQAPNWPAAPKRLRVLNSP